MNVEGLERGKHEPSSERWLQYYAEAKVRRREKGARGQRSRAAARWRARERALVIGALLALTLLFGVCYAVLAR